VHARLRMSFFIFIIALLTIAILVTLGHRTPACTGGSLAMIADNGYGSPGGDVMSLDCAGNMILKGSVVTQGTPLIRAGGSNG
jgi:hypothetical protein